MSSLAGTRRVVPRWAATAAAAAAFLLAAVPAGAATASATPAPASVGAVAPAVEGVRFTDTAGTSSTYRLTNATGARGLLVYLDGDGQFAVDHPDSDLLGQPGGLEAAAAARGLAVLTPRTPDTATGTWWREADRNAAYVDDLTRAVTAHLAVREVWFVTFSGGSQLLTKTLLARNPGLCTGGAVIVGGGGPPTTTASSGAPSCPLWWITGTDDTGDGYDALTDARRGAGTYWAAGAPALLSTPAGLDHADARTRIPTWTAGAIDHLRTHPFTRS